MVRQGVGIFCVAIVLTACSEGPAPTVAEVESVSPVIGDFGLDLEARDATVRPGADFFRFANGGWLDTNEIPADRTRWGSFDVLRSEAEIRVQELVESLPDSAESGVSVQKVADFYRAYVDTAAIEAAGLAPAQAGLQAIDEAGSHDEVAALMGRPDMPVEVPIGFRISVDEKNPDRYVAYLGQSGLGLPDREYYLKDDTAFTEIRSQYVEHIGRMLDLAGEDDASGQAQTILDLETQMAHLHWPIEKRRDRDLTYNPHTLEELEALAPGFPWSQLFETAGLSDVDRREFIVRELDAVEGLARVFRQVPISTWHSYLKYHYLTNVADVLPQAFGDETFDFFGRQLSGQEEQREREKLAVSAVNGALGEAVGEVYVERHFPPASKTQMTALVENLRLAYAQRIEALPWMSDDTKQVALEKLAAFRPKIGYPDAWRDYSALEVRPGDAFGNRLRAAVFGWERRLARIDDPTDRDEWGMTPQTVNAYYNSTFNEVVFPAAILQAPFFDPHADDAVNFGAIGAVIGHEMGHGFDDQGSKSDAAGVLRTWWQPEDEAAFEELVAGLADQYDGYEVLPGLNVNGRLTLGENIGDLGGLTVALEAYRISLDGREAPIIDGLTGVQRFFLSWAQVWRALTREEQLRTQVMSDPHSPPQLRVNGVVRNMDAWYDAFGVEAGDALYLAPDERVSIW